MQAAPGQLNRGGRKVNGGQELRRRTAGGRRRRIGLRRKRSRRGRLLWRYVVQCESPLQANGLGKHRRRPLRGDVSSDQLGDRATVVDHRRGTPVEVFDHRRRGVNPEVMVDGRQEVAGAANPLD